MLWFLFAFFLPMEEAAYTYTPLSTPPAQTGTYHVGPNSGGTVEFTPEREIVLL